MDIFYFMSSMGLFTQRECLLIAGSFTEVKLKRKQFFLSAGEQCDHLAFIVKGSMRIFGINDRGNEYTFGFGIENRWMTDFESFANGGCSRYSIEVLEDTVTLLIGKGQLEQLMEQVPMFARLIDEQLNLHMITCQQRMYAAMGFSAEERFSDLLHAQPEFIRRFPQVMIASYLGITAQTLSRVRKQLSLKTNRRVRAA